VSLSLTSSSPEELLTERAIALVRRVEPLADAANMELVATVLARQLGQALVRSVQHAVANQTLFDTLHLAVDVGLQRRIALMMSPLRD